MIKKCDICNAKFKTTNPNKKYCSVGCRKERIREIDRLRKRKARQEARDIQNATIEEQRRIKREQKQKEIEEVRKNRMIELNERVAAGDPLAKMTLAKPFSTEYWEAYKDYEIQQSKHYDNKTIRYVNGISVHDNDFIEMIMIMIEQQGIIYSELVRA